LNPKGTHTDDQNPGRKWSTCIPKGHIDSGASMYPKGAHNCLPLPKQEKESNVADERGRSDGLMSYVAVMIQQQLDQHEARLVAA